VNPTALVPGALEALFDRLPELQRADLMTAADDVAACKFGLANGSPGGSRSAIGGYHLFSPQDRTDWLLGIGRRLRAEYNVLLAAPLPPRLAALVRQGRAKSSLRSIKRMRAAVPAKNVQINGICERFHKIVLSDFCVAFRKKMYRSMWSHEHNVLASPRGQRG
jgi:hypothetical protein